MSLAQATRLLVFVNSRLLCGSNAYPLHVIPPKYPGTISEPFKLGGVKMPSLRNFLMVSRQFSRSCGVGPHASSADICCAANGGGATGNGCVGDVTSPGTSLCGTGRSSTGNTGFPVSRFST